MSRFQDLGGTPVIGCAVLLTLAVFSWFGVFAFDWGQAEDFLLLDWYRRLVVTGEWSYLDLATLQNGPHPLGFQALTSTTWMRLFGPKLLPVVALNFVLVWLAVVALFARVAPGLSVGRKWLLLLCLFCGLFHPTMTNHLFWAFELGWFQVTLFLVLGSIAVEASSRRPVWLGVAAAMCVLAVFSSGQGAFVPVALSAQLALAGRYKTALVFVGLFLGAAASAGGGNWATTQRDFSFVTSPLSVAAYMLQLAGSFFGIREKNIAMLGGAVALAASMLMLGYAVLSRVHLTSVQRICVGLTVYSLAASAAFGYARYAESIEWAFNVFHVAPLLFGLYLGPTLFVLIAAGRGEDRHESVALLCPLVLFASFVLAVPYGWARSSEAQLVRAVAMRASCDPSSPAVLAAHLNGLAKAPHAIPLVRDNWPLLSQLCSERVPSSALALLTLPATYQGLLRRDAELGDALVDLWRVYSFSVDLQRAFPLRDLKTPRKLLEFADNDARAGSSYEPSMLKQHAETLIRAKELLSKQEIEAIRTK